MNTNLDNTKIAEAYYTAMEEQNFAEMEHYLHPDIQFIGPLTELSGREAVLDAAKKFSTLFLSLTIRSKFNSENQVMLAYDLYFPEPIGKLRAAVLMTFHTGLIIKLELFFDGRPLAK